jgi:hypothetical protein
MECSTVLSTTRIGCPMENKLESTLCLLAAAAALADVQFPSDLAPPPSPPPPPLSGQQVVPQGQSVPKWKLTIQDG